MPDERLSYKVVAEAAGPHEIVEKGSRFIATLHPVGSSQEVSAVVALARKAHHGATHVCSAYRLLLERGEESRSSDDGEPSGTAGLPMHNELKRAGVFNTLALVVRYFGGVKLGTGGLARAYGRAVREALACAQIQECPVTRCFRLAVPFDLSGAVPSLLKRHHAVVSSRDYAVDGEVLEVRVPISEVSSLSRLLQDRSSGRVRLVESS